MEQGNKLLEVEKLRKYFPVRGGFFQRQLVRAVESVSFCIYRGETMGLVGESGCGKSTLGRTILRLCEPTAGRIVYDGTPIYDSEARLKADMLPYRRRMQIIFQDPSSSLDPRMTAGEIVGEGLDVHHRNLSKSQRAERIRYFLDRVGLNSEHANRFANEFSGGQQQRVGIARALAVEPEFLVLDEPVSALDVSIQSQVVNMLEDLQAESHLTYLFIAHDISVVRHISRRIGVMYLGSLVELAESRELCVHPMHPYTRSLISAAPLPDPDKARARKRAVLEGEPPSPIHPPAGCHFHTRCARASAKCSEETPKLREIAPGHFAACHVL